MFRKTEKQKRKVITIHCKDILWVCLPLLFLLAGSFSSLAYGETPQKADIVVAFSPKSLIDVDYKDAMSAFKIYVEELSHQMNHTGAVFPYDTLDSVLKEAENGKVDLISLSSIDYLRIKSKANLELAFGNIRGGKSTLKYFLLTHEDKGFKSLADLKGKRFVYTRGENISLLFLNTVLLKQHLPEAKDYFSAMEEKAKPSQAVLSVFFGQADVCIVNDVAFRTMTEMNPQLEKKLKVVISSPELLDNITVFRKSFDTDMKLKALEVARRLKTTPRGKQMLMLVKVDDLIPLKESDLTGIRELVAEHDKLKPGR
jgi:ABC-type phosphate/phosphonate transport system substrate-binding protein